MQVYCCQLDIEWENKEANYRRAQEMISAANPEPGSLLVLPEMFGTGFSMNVAAIHEGETSPTEEFLRRLARQFNCCVLGGLVKREASGKGRNEAVAFAPGGDLLARYVKIHPFSLGGETRHYISGNQISIFEWGGFKIAPFVCYDLRFPEIFREAVRAGAEVMVVIANWPSKREQHWVTLLQARAIENLAYVVGVNRSGRDPQHIYPGRSMIINPHGVVEMDAGDQQMVISSRAALEVVRGWRDQFPALRDMHWNIQA